MRDIRRVVITGVGPVSGIGIGREAFTAGLWKGAAAIAPVTTFDTSRYHAKRGALIPNFDVKEYLESEKAYLDRASELAFAGMSLAFEDANIDPAQLHAEETALLLGSAYGNVITAGIFFDDFLKKGPRLVKPILFPHTYSNSTISLLAIEYGLSGYHVSFSSGCVSSALALAEAFDLIHSGRATMAIAGGFEALSEIVYAGMDHGGALSPGKGGPEQCLPFSPDRNGLILGEGCAILVLEALDSARARNATILAEITGVGMASDAAISEGAGSRGIAKAMMHAMAALTREASPVHGIMAAANGSIGADASEAAAIAAVFGDASPPVTSIKPLIGETLGASGAFGAIASLASIQGGFLPAMPACSRPGGSTSLRLVSGESLESDIRRMIVNAVDPGGSAVSIVMQALK